MTDQDNIGQTPTSASDEVNRVNQQLDPNLEAQHQAQQDIPEHEYMTREHADPSAVTVNEVQTLNVEAADTSGVPVEGGDSEADDQPAQQ